MDIELVRQLTGTRKKKWRNFLLRAGLEPDEQTESTALIWDGDTLIATGSRMGNLLKCIAVDEPHQGEGLTATVLTQLRQDAFSHGYNHLFLYTKPKNEFMFSSLFFYPVAKTDTVLLMENRHNGITDFLNTLPAAEHSGTVGAVVMNCNPFTKGHRHLIETAAGECDHLYIFVLSEEKSEFPAADRIEMVKLGTEDLSNVTVLPTGPYLISSATFPTYFLKDREHAEQIHCLLDIEIFCRYYAPRFHITRRYVGTEPLSRITEQYNRALKEHLPGKGIQLLEIPRLEHESVPISASTVRMHLNSGDEAALLPLLPDTTYAYLKTHHYFK